MRKKLDENALVLKWPAPFRDGIKFTNHDLGTLDVIIGCETEITAKDLEEMKKYGYIFDRMAFYISVDESLKGKINVQDDLLAFLEIAIRFRRYQALPLENGGKSDRQVL